MTAEAANRDLRPLGTTGISVSTIALGCWPIAGMSSPGVVEAESLATILACFDLGINFLDTAYCLRHRGRKRTPDRPGLAGRRKEMVIATKGGIEWGAGSKADHRWPARARSAGNARKACGAWRTDRVELYYLHAPDPKVPMAESAGEIRRLIAEGKVLSAGGSNVECGAVGGLCRPNAR